MRFNRLLGSLAFLYSIVASVAYGAPDPNTAFYFGEARDTSRQARYVSGDTVYTEALMADRWVGRHWSADGTFKVAYEGFEQESFLVEVDGEALPNSWELISAGEVSTRREGDRETAVRLKNKSLPVTVTLRTVLDGTPVITRWLEIENTGKSPIALTGVFPWKSMLIGHNHYWGETQLPRRFEHPFTLGYFTKKHHCWEGWFDWLPIDDESDIPEIGCSLGECFDDPFFVVRNDARGYHLIGHLEWSSNWRLDVDYLCPGAHHLLLFKIGPWASKPLRVIAPQETVKTPAVHLGMVAGDLDTTVQAMHDHIRGSVSPDSSPDRRYLVQYMLPGDQGYLSRRMGDHSGYTEESVKKNIDLAAAIGAELFIADAGWWDHRGDWRPSKERFPNGLKPLAEYAQKKNMLFGLYCEIEMASTASTVGRQHPEWIDWYPPFSLLNLALPDAAAHVESELRRMVRDYRLDLFRLDFNVPAGDTQEGKSFARHGIEENNIWRYYEGFHGVFDRVHRDLPDLVLQQAASGGGRNDLATVRRFHEQYLTDGLRMPMQVQNYAGQTMALPPEIFVIAHGADAGGGFGSAENLRTNLRVAFTLSTPHLFAGTVAPSVEEMTPRRLKLYRHYVKLYKEFIRPILPTSKVFHHAPISARGGVESSGFFAMEFAAPDRSRGWATVIRIGPSEGDTYILKPRGLHRGRRYQVTLDSSNEVLTVDGLSLARDGIPLRLEALSDSELVLFEGD